MWYCQQRGGSLSSLLAVFGAGTSEKGVFSNADQASLLRPFVNMRFKRSDYLVGAEEMI
jgi:hypothetical protein